MTMTDHADQTPTITHLAVRGLHLVAPDDYRQPEWDLVGKLSDGTLRYSEQTWGNEAEASQALHTYRPQDVNWQDSKLTLKYCGEVSWRPYPPPQQLKGEEAAAQTPALTPALTLDEPLRQTLLAALEDRKERLDTGLSSDEAALGSEWAQQETDRVNTLKAMLRAQKQGAIAAQG